MEINNKNLKNFLKYCTVGTMGAVIDIGILYILVEFFDIVAVLGASIAFVFAVVNNFFWNKHWTFEDNSKKHGKQFIKFLSVSVVGLLLTTGLMYFGVNILEIWYLPAKIIIILIVLLWNFLANSWWTFAVQKD